MKDAQHWIESLNLQPHPEGGFYKEVYRSENEIDKSALHDSYSGNRNTLTSIFFLLRQSDYSHFHILKSDEIWYFHGGNEGVVHTISSSGKYTPLPIGPNSMQAVIPAGTYFAAELCSKEANQYLLVGCAVAPGFDFEDFRMASEEELLAICPAQQDLIERMTL